MSGYWLFFSLLWERDESACAGASEQKNPPPTFWGDNWTKRTHAASPLLRGGQGQGRARAKT